MSTVIKNGHVVDPKNKVDSVMDVLISKGKIEKVGKGLTGDKEIDAKGKIVVPGLIDMHVHLREPGREDKETIETCSRAAARGGFTSIVGMPNTTPTADDQTVVKYVCSIAKETAIVNVFPTGNITKGSKGKELAQIGDLKRAGAIAVTDDGWDIKNTNIMRMAMEYLHKWQLPIISHSEDFDLSGKDWAMHEGRVSTRLGLPGKPAEAEEVAIAKQIVLSSLTGYPIHFTHVNSVGALGLIKDAKKKGLKVTCDTCPHYFTLTDENVVGYDPNMKMNPPLRPKRHLKAVVNGLNDGTIDCITTDHAPHLLIEKYLEFEHCVNGIVGLETSLPLVMTYLVNNGEIDMNRMVELMSLNPATILNLEGKGHLGVGADADITIIDKDAKETIDKTLFESKGRNTPFDGWEVVSLPVMTIVNGKVVMKNRKIL
jgi:dihydroorotase